MKKSEVSEGLDILREAMKNKGYLLAWQANIAMAFKDEIKGKIENLIHEAANDAAFKKDHFTFSVVGHFENRIKQYVLKGWKGTKKHPVKAKDVAEYARVICKEYGIDEVAADQYSFEPLREIFSQYGVTLIEKPFSLTFKKQIYFNLKRLIHSQQMDLLDVEELSKELKELVIEQTGSGQIRIGHPPGGSDDYADSTAIAAYLAVESAGQIGYDLKMHPRTLLFSL